MRAHEGARWALAAFLAVTAAFSFGTGRSSGSCAAAVVGHGGRICASAFSVSLWASWRSRQADALKFFVPGGGSVGHRWRGAQGDLVARPMDSALCCSLLGHTLGQGTDVEAVDLCAVGAALLVFLTCAGFALTRKSAALRREAWPWIAIGLWADQCVGDLLWSHARAAVPRPAGAFCSSSSWAR
jgi:hypothetical protein